MADNADPIVIKKYANRRLYNTATADFVTLDDLLQMVKDGTPFTVKDVKTDADITCSVLAQIIAEEETRGNNMLPLSYLRQILKLYHEGVGPQVASYLEQSMDGFIANQQQIIKQMSGLMGGATSPDQWMEMGRRNMEIFQNSLSMFHPNGAPGGAASAPAASGGDGAGAQSREEEIDALKRELAQIQSRLNDLSK